MSQQEFRRVDCKFTWKVDDFLVRAAYVKPGAVIPSPVFTVDDPLGVRTDARFRLRLCPNALDHVALFIYNDGREDVTVDAVVYMLDESEQKVHEARSESCFLRPKEHWGWATFCPKSAIESNVDKVLVSGAVKFGCELKLLLPVSDPETFPSLGDELFVAMKKKGMTDVTLVCGEKRFDCHKFILAARSSVFAEMFEKTNEEDRTEIFINEMEPHVMEKVLKFIYTDTVDLSEHSKELFIAAERCNVRGLKKMAEHHLMSNLNVENVAEVLTLFDNFGCDTEGLEDKAVKYAMRNLPAVIRTEAWQRTMPEAHPRLVKMAFQELASQKES